MSVRQNYLGCPPRLVAFNDPPIVPNPKPVILITLPKSGSMYLYHTLRMTYDLPTMQHFGGEFPNTEYNRNMVHELAGVKGISQTHCSASHHNLVVLDHFFDRAILHVRDPRQALLSWVHSIESNMKDSAIDHAIFGFDDAFFKLPLSERIDREIQSYFPGSIRWLEQWIDAIEQKRKCRIKITRYEDMVCDPQKMARDIASCFDLPVNKELIHPDARTMHFREGQTDEWRSVFTKAQIGIVNSMIPSYVMDYFGWDFDHITIPGSRGEDVTVAL